jgi:FixJ family two-component response regulator
MLARETPAITVNSTDCLGGHAHLEPDDAWPAVFVVDDDACLRSLFGDWVEHAGFQAVRLASGEACLSALACRTPIAIILDVHMGGISGGETLEAIRCSGSDIPIFVLSGESDPDVATDLIQRGATEFMTKPVRRTELVRALLGVSSVRGLATAS